MTKTFVVTRNNLITKKKKCPDSDCTGHVVRKYARKFVCPSCGATKVSALGSLCMYHLEA